MMLTLFQGDIVGVENRTLSLYLAIYSSDFFTSAIGMVTATANMTNSSNIEDTPCLLRFPT
jgi:hypothetical protein